MKRYKLIITVLFFALTGCVQKAYVKTIIVKLTIPGKKNIGAVGVRGSGNPLNWNTDYPLTPLIKDSVYGATITTKTAFKFGEIKFTVDGDWELKDKPNRKVFFDEKKDTVFVNAVFNRE